ncbi:adhesion G protein-coupled receptor F4 [Engraulis encrasicolus]|uniref:adhesion G protein-coupled receptor F4 n=1 Tax=Engraulis encrasicolus TaxID=184585 RepID=UPI002FD0FEB5
MKLSTEKTNINSNANIDQSVQIFAIIRETSETKNQTLGPDAVPDFLTSANNLLNDTLNGSWDNVTAAFYLFEVNRLLLRSNVSEDLTRKNIELKKCKGNCKSTEVFGVKVKESGSKGPLLATGFKKLAEYLPQIKDEESRGIVIEVQAEGHEDVTLTFPEVNRTANHEMSCVVWLPEKKMWSKEVCTWGGADNPGVCVCKLNNNNLTSRSQTKGYLGASFTVFMSKNPVIIPYMNYLTWIGVSVSILSLIICVLIEGIVWSSVVKSDIAHFRHTAVVNISLSLLLADISFLATAFESKPTNWCWWLVVVKHYCFLAMFFWMLCLSLVLLHSLVFVFQHLSKKFFLIMSLTVGYVCPLIIVVLTYIAYGNGKADSYYLPETCWLKYEGTFQGSFFAFVMPVGIIICINILSMMVVIVRLLKPSVSESRSQDDKDIIRSILKAVILLTPIFGVTWIFGFFILTIDYTQRPMSDIVNYLFTGCNAFQGFFILVTACLSEKKVRETLCGKISWTAKVYKTSTSNASASRTSNESSLKKK